MEEPEYKSFIDTLGIPVDSYWVVDCNGEEVEVQTRNSDNHQSTNDWAEHPTYHFNLGVILTHPDEIEESVSNHPAAVEARRRGRIVEFRKHNFIKSLGIPGYEDYYDITTLVVFYPNDNSGNYTKTVMSKPKLDD